MTGEWAYDVKITVEKEADGEEEGEKERAGVAAYDDENQCCMLYLLICQYLV